MDESWIVRFFTAGYSREEYNRLRDFALKEFTPLVMTIGVYPPLDKLAVAFVVSFVSMVVYAFYTTIAIVTCFYSFDDFVLWSEVIHHTGLMVFALFVRVVILSTTAGVLEVTRSMMDGVFKYDEDFVDSVFEQLRVVNRKLRIKLIVCPAMVLAVTGIAIGLKPLIDYITEVPPHPTLVENGVNYKILFPLICPFPTDNLLSLMIVNGGLLYFVALMMLPAVGAILMFITVSCRISLELSILIESLNLLGTRAQRLFARRHGMGSEPDQNWSLYEDCIECCLKENIQHHQNIKQFYDRYSCIAAPVVGGGFFICALVLGLGMIVVNMDDVNISDIIAFTGAAVAEAVTAYMIAWISEEIGDLSYELYNAVYGLDWLSWRKPNKKLVITFLEGTREPLYLNAFGMATINMEAFGEVVSRAYSFLNLVRASESLELYSEER